VSDRGRDQAGRPAPPDWRDLGYLAAGSPRQRRAQGALMDLGILRDLAGFGAVLIGTVPLAIDVPDSDLDIACHAPDLDALAAALARLYGSRPGYVAARGRRPGTFVARLRHGREQIEVFGQGVPVEAQAGFRHMVVEWRLLALGGERLRRAVLALRLRGVKTEPAFAQLLGLAGDPYTRLLELHAASDAELAELVGAGDGADAG
jgi:hypothetical protein